MLEIIGPLNIFRILGDLSHVLSKCILIWSIHYNKSAEGVSLLTQVLYALVFILRYLDLFTGRHELPWNHVLKILYISSSLYIVLIMMKFYARTREREKAWKFGAYCLGGSVVIGPIVGKLAEGADFTFLEALRNMSLVLESVCVLPQLLLLRQTTVPTVIDSGYILTLGSYRAFYILNWIVRFFKEDHHFEWPAVLFGIIQTAFYVDFAWVYYTRQRVKLRGGSIVDSDDLRRGYLVQRIMNRGDAAPDEEEAGPGDDADGASKSSRGRWGPRGISVSADDEVTDHDWQSRNKADPVDHKNAWNDDDETDAILQNPDDYEDGLSGLDDDDHSHHTKHTNGRT